ncbi:MAG: hypothetical protein HY094_02530 [Candidatus Melainabacteria bacterium]|nr:hypothetical protein [Candidatus Melainabacteria bacterium]
MVNIKSIRATGGSSDNLNQTSPGSSANVNNSNATQQLANMDASKLAMRAGEANNSASMESNKANVLDGEATSGKAAAKELLEIAKEEVKQAKISPMEIARQLLIDAKNKIQQVLEMLRNMMQKEAESKNAKVQSEKDFDIARDVQNNSLQNNNDTNPNQPKQGTIGLDS